MILEKKTLDHLHLMARVVNLSQLSSECAELFNRYKLIKQLAVGVGTVGTLYEVINTETKEISVLKLFKYADGVSENEVRIATLVTGIPGFIKLKNWFMCESLPAQWLAVTTTEFDLSGKLVYIEMQKADGSLYNLLIDNRVLLTKEDLISILFEITVGLWNAQIQLHLCHRDIKLDNILFLANPTPRIYELPNGQTAIAKSAYQPLIADFGNAQVREEPCAEDVNGYHTMVSQNFLPLDRSEELIRLLEILDETGDFSLIIQTPYFQPLFS